MTHRKTTSALVCFLMISFCGTGLCAKIVYPWNATTAIVKRGDSFAVWFDADVGQSITSVELRGPYNSVSIPSVTSETGSWTYDTMSGDTYDTRVSVSVPSTAPEDRYDLILNTSSGREISLSAVKVVKEYRANYTIFHISDTHICDESYRAPDGVPKRLWYLSALVDIANIIGPEMVFLTGDNVNSRSWDDGNARYLATWPSTQERTDFYYKGSHKKGCRGVHDFKAAAFSCNGNHDHYERPADGRETKNKYEFWNTYHGLRTHHFAYGDTRFMAFCDAFDENNDAEAVQHSAWLKVVGPGTLRVIYKHFFNIVPQPWAAENQIQFGMCGHNHHKGVINPHTQGSTDMYIANFTEYTTFNLFRVDVEGHYTVLNNLPAIENPKDVPSLWRRRLTLTYANANDGSSNTNTATLVNHFDVGFPRARVRFVMPKGASYAVSKGQVEQAFDGDSVHVVDVRVNILSHSTTSMEISRTDGIRPADLRCEYLANPLGIDVVKPRLSWQLESEQRTQKQTAYRLLVASSRDRLDKNVGDLWDSGKVQSDRSVHVAYRGKTLQSRRQCFWKVMVWDKEGKPSTWSEPACWTMGLLLPEDWKAKWVGTPEAATSPYYRQLFQVEDTPERATIYVAALGYFELFVNGQKVGDEVLAPAVSNFSKRSYYRTYDVTRYLKKGNNSLGIWMGTGWYSPGLPGVKHHSPVVRAQLELSSPGKEQRLITDTSWETKPSARKLLGEWRWGKFGGECVDARLLDKQWWHAQKSTQGWTPVEAIDVAEVPCSAQSCAGNVRLAPIAPRSVERLGKDTFLVDFGTNLTGMMNMTLRNLMPGQKITLHYGDLDGRQADEAWRAKQTRKGFAVYGQYDEFISAGAAEEQFSNVFNYHAFRYVLIEGLSYAPEKADMAAMPVETKVDETGTFTCSNELYNRIHNMVRWTYRCLNLGGQTVDCPHRERLGYGDGQTIMDTGCFNFDAASLYAKWSHNWWDEQTDDGFVPFTAPCPHNTGGGPAWGAMCIMVPWKTYLFYDDRRLLEHGYPYMKKYLDYLNAHCEEGILQDIFPGERWPNLGDWVPPRRGMDKKNWVDDTSRRFFNNCYRVYLLQTMQKIAGVLGRDDDVKVFEREIHVVQKKVHDTWFNPKDNAYANGEQPYLIFPLKTGVTPEPLRHVVFKKYVETLLVKDKGHLNTGMIGTQIMVDSLLEMNRNDLVDTMVNKTTYPGWGYMVEKGATTCWEQWNGYFSQIHSCFPYIGGWFYRGLAGIRWDPEIPGFKHVILRPGLVKSVDWVKCSYDCPYGRIVSNWKRENGLFRWDVSVPVNSTATIFMPAKDIKSIREGGKSLQQARGVTFLRMKGGSAVLRVGSGRYRFVSQCH